MTKKLFYSSSLLGSNVNISRHSRALFRIRCLSVWEGNRIMIYGNVMGNAISLTHHYSNIGWFMRKFLMGKQLRYKLLSYCILRMYYVKVNLKDQISFK